MSNLALDAGKHIIFTIGIFGTFLIFWMMLEHIKYVNDIKIRRNNMLLDDIDLDEFFEDSLRESDYFNCDYNIDYDFTHKCYLCSKSRLEDGKIKNFIIRLKRGNFKIPVCRKCFMDYKNKTGNYYLIRDDLEDIENVRDPEEFYILECKQKELN